MSLTKNDLKQISDTLEPKFTNIEKQMRNMNIVMERRFIEQTLSFTNELRTFGMDLRKSLVKMVKESYELFSQNHPTREEVDTQIDDLRDEFNLNTNILRDK